jgi:hypothetical protein
VLAGILGGLVLAIAVVALYYRKVFFPDHDSSLSEARLLRTTMEAVKGRSLIFMAIRL